MTQQRPQFTTQAGTISPGATVEIIRVGNFLTCLEASHPFKIGFDSAPVSDFEEGLSLDFSGVSFERITLVNPSSEALTYKLAIGRGLVRDARLVLSDTVAVAGEVDARLIEAVPLALVDGTSVAIEGTPTVALDGTPAVRSTAPDLWKASNAVIPAVVVGPGQTASEIPNTLIVPANPRRRELILRCREGTDRVGVDLLQSAEDTGSSNALRIELNDVLRIETAAAVYGRVRSGGVGGTDSGFITVVELEHAP